MERSPTGVAGWPLNKGSTEEGYHLMHKYWLKNPTYVNFVNENMD